MAELIENESEIVRRGANMTMKGRGVGGHLTLTNNRLIFEQHGVEKALTGGFEKLQVSDWQCELSSIASVRLSERGRNPFDGSLRKRLEITQYNGEVNHFVVNGAKKLIDQIQNAMPSPGS